jgi:hypothetical protein
MSTEIVITRHGQSAGVRIGFTSLDDWLDCRLENDRAFLARIESARADVRAGRRRRIDDLSAGFFSSDDS